MPNCTRCQGSTTPGHLFCLGCLNDWLTMRAVCLEHLVKQHGEATRATMPIFTKEVQRLDALWKRDRAAFEAEIKIFLNPINTTK